MKVKAKCGHSEDVPPYFLDELESCRSCHGKESWEGVVRGEPVGQKTQRLRVPGGWLYRTIMGNAGRTPVAMVFVPELVEDEKEE
jgi:hypothetical protein